MRENDAFSTYLMTNRLDRLVIICLGLGVVKDLKDGMGPSRVIGMAGECDPSSFPFLRRFMIGIEIALCN